MHCSSPYGSLACCLTPRGAHSDARQSVPAKRNPPGFFCQTLIDLLIFPRNAVAGLLPRLCLARRPSLVGLSHRVFTLFRRGLAG